MSCVASAVSSSAKWGECDTYFPVLYGFNEAMYAKCLEVPMGVMPTKLEITQSVLPTWWLLSNYCFVGTKCRNTEFVLFASLHFLLRFCSLLLVPVSLPHFASVFTYHCVPGLTLSARESQMDKTLSRNLPSRITRSGLHEDCGSLGGGTSESCPCLLLCRRSLPPSC